MRSGTCQPAAASMRVLIVEDEKKIVRFIHKALAAAGHTVDECHRGDDALSLATGTAFDVIVLDIMLPGRDGLSVLRELRERRDLTPVLLLTARGDVSERVEGLNLGADDYLAKPFAMDELIARINALGRRATSDHVVTHKLEDLTVNLLTREVARAGKTIELTTREFALLDYLLRNPGRVVTRTQICEQVWNWHFDSGTNVVDVYIKRLRRKIDDGHEVKLLHTVRGIGYCMKGPE
jgi:DNA-binding response OmpR family regulator